MDERNKKNSDWGYYAFAFKLVGDFGAAIALPVVALVILGRFLDSRFGFRWFFTIIGFVLAIIVSGKIIYQKAKIYGKKYEAMNKKEDK